MAQRRKFVAGNWKMHGSLANNLALLDAVKSGAAALACEVAVCVPYPYLAQAKSVLGGSNVAWGAQDVSAHAQGAYTGEVSAAMLVDFGCRYAIVGHSERRTLHAESDQLVADKFAAALGAGVTPILCVGETLAEREAGITDAVVTRQLEAVLAKSGVAALARAVVAYEPVWAIGTGKTPTPQQAQDAHAAIRARVARDDGAVAAGLQILYGGSVKAGNAKELFAMADIDGGLIGGAALVAADFLAICAAG
ncbi:MAG TPA: triose-phosphate isomerase [Rhodocyclaceae bacterium]|nr:triose-phosphate isomerase [Rhodocyclaceae bacterium]